MSSEAAVKRFIQALGELERNGDVEPIASLFSDRCEVSNVMLPGVLHGRDGARSFWRSYRANFHDVRSSFRLVLADGDRAALEWATVGSTREGSPIEYEGTSVLEFDEDERICRFVAYFDPRAVGRSVERALHTEAEPAP